MSSSSTLSSTSSASQSPVTSDTSTSTGGTSSTVYLFTFLVTVLVLGFISAGLLFRAYFIRRRVRRHIQEAMARGEITTEFVESLSRVPKGPKLGPMPTMWEAKMALTGDDTYYDGPNDEEWDFITPVGIVHFPPPEPPCEPEPMPSAPPHLSFFAEMRQTLLEMRPRTLGPGPRYPATMAPPTAPAPITMSPPVVADPPPSGSEVLVGVLIALPVEGQGLDCWEPDDPEEADIPQVCLGVMECTIAGDSDEWSDA